MITPLIKVRDVVKTFGGRGRKPGKTAVAGVDLDLFAGESLGIVGESGCGKTTLARMLVGLETPTSGVLEVMGADITRQRGVDRRDAARRIQMVFQDPYSSLNPRKSVGEIVAAPLETVHRMPRVRVRERVLELLEQVGLQPAERYIGRYPKDLSGGQRQRVGIARAMALEPEVIVADEPVSALDVSVRAQILNLFNDLRRTSGVSYVFISHDLAVVRSVCDRVVVMNGGRIVEQGPTEAVFAAPQHEYTRMLIDASLEPDPTRYRGEPARGGEAGTALQEESS